MPHISTGWHYSLPLSLDAEAQQKFICNCNKVFYVVAQNEKQHWWKLTSSFGNDPEFTKKDKIYLNWDGLASKGKPQSEFCEYTSVGGAPLSVWSTSLAYLRPWVDSLWHYKNGMVETLGSVRSSHSLQRYELKNEDLRSLSASGSLKPTWSTLDPISGKQKFVWESRAGQREGLWKLPSLRSISKDQFPMRIPIYADPINTGWSAAHF